MKRKLLPVIIFLLFFLGSYVLIYHSPASKNLQLDKKTASLKNITYQRNYPLDKKDSASKNSNQETDGILVTRVVDGDTIEIEGGQKVRYIGIDTPETVDP